MKLDQAGLEKLSHCICTGIVVTYARSFGANQGLSGMGSEFRKFPDPRMQSLHDFLLEGRDAIYAHKDRKKEVSRLSTAKEQEEVGKIEIHISETGTTEWEVKCSSLPDKHIPDIAAICDFQIGRINNASTAMLGHFFQGKSYAPGTYLLGENFP